MRIPGGGVDFGWSSSIIGQRVPPNCHCKDRGRRTESMNISSVVQEEQIDPGRATLGWFEDHHTGFLNKMVMVVVGKRDIHMMAIGCAHCIS